MSYLIIFVTGLLIGAVAGLLIYRKHAASLKATRPGLAVRGTFSPARAWRPAVVARSARTVEETLVAAITFRIYTWFM